MLSLCSFLQVTEASYAAHRWGSREQFQTFKMEIKLLKEERDGLSEAADLILQIAFPDGPEEGVPSAWQERLKLVPDWLKAQLKQTMMTATVQALAVVKSHYPRVDLQRFEEGFTADADDAKLEALSLEVEHTAESLGRKPVSGCSLKQSANI